MCGVFGFEGLFDEMKVDGFVFCVFVDEGESEVYEEEFLRGNSRTLLSFLLGQ